MLQETRPQYAISALFSQTYIASSLQHVQGLHRCIEEIIFSFTYPRLDMEVCEVPSTF